MSRLTIHKGVFRSDQKSVDVTGKLASLIEDDILKLHSDFASTLSVQLEGGDKALEIEFSVDSGEVQTVRVADGGPLYISCPPVSSGSASSSSSSSSSAAAPDYGLCAAGHPLTKGHNGYASGWLCDHCRYSAAESQERVICSPCKADFCDTCAPKHVNTKKIRCRSGHQLYLSNNKEGGYSSGYVCRECAKQKTGWRWFCEPCTDDLCPDCYEKFTPSDVVFPEPGRFEGDLGGDWAAEEANADLTTLRLWFRPRKAGEAVRLRKLYLVPRSDLPVSPESGSPIPYYAVVEGATLKKSKGQDAFTSQDATAGKYAAQKLCWSKTDKGRLVATPKRGSDAVAVVLRPPHGTAVFPSFSAIRLAFVADSSSSSSEGSSSSGAQQPELVRIEAVPRGESGWIPVAHEGKKDTVDVGTGLRLFRPTEALLSKLSGHDGAALRAAFNHMPPALHGFALAPSALTQLLSAALAKRSAETLALLLSQVELQPMVYDETLRLLLADYQGGNDFVESAVRLVFSSGPRPGLPAFAQAFALGRPAVVDLLATLEPSILSDYAEELVQVALAVDYDYVRYVASSIASVQNPAPKQLPSLPSLSVLTNPSPAVLLAAHRSPDRRAFDELIAVSTRGSLAAFFNEVFAGRLSECTPALLRAGFDKGVELTAVVRPDSNVLDLALASHQSELASLLFRQGLRCHVGNARALLRAFQSRDDAAFSLLEAEGCPVPLYHLFALLTANAELAEESIDRALRILFAPGRLTPNSQLPRAGRSLVAQALAAKNIPLASRLVAQGASLPESDGPSIFAQAFRDGVPARALAAAIEFRSPHDKDILQPALLAYLRQCPANDVDNLHRFLRAVPDLDFEVDGVAPLTAALDNASVDLEVVNALLSAGAKAPEGFALDLIPKYFESLLFPQYLHLVEQDSNINYANLLCRLMVNSPAVLKTIVGREIVAHILGQSPDLSSPVDYVIQSNVEGPHVDRFGHASMSWGYSGSPDAISFSVSQPLTLMGIGAYGGQSGDYNVRVELREGTCALSGEVLASATETFQCPGSEITPILFDVPVQLSDNTQYTAVINYSSTISTYYGQDGQTSVNVGDITFNFQTPSDGSHNGTTNTSGQIPRLYIKGNSKGGRPDNFEPLPLLAVAALTQKDEALFDRLYAAGSRLPSVAPETKRGKTLFDRSYQAALKNYSDLTSVLSAYLSSKKTVGEFLRALQKLPARAVAYTPSLVEAFLAECTDPGLLLAQALQANSDIVQLPFGKAIVDYALEKSPDFSRSFPVESGGEPLSARRLASVSSSSSNWGYSGTPDSIAFKVSEPVLITGIGAVGGSGSDYRVTISIREGNTASGTVLGSALREFTSSDSTIVPLSFDEPIAVEPDVYYCAVICYESRHNTYSGESGLGTLTVDDVRFEFQSTSDNNNGTSVSSGQVHSLLFTKGLAIGDNPLELPLLAIAAFTQKNGALFDTLYQAGARNLPAPEGLTPEQSELRAKLIQKGFKNLLRYGANPISAFDSFFDPSNVKPSEFVGLCDSLPDDSSEHVEELAAKFLQARGTDGAAALIHDLMDSDSNILAKDIARSLIEKSLESRPNAATRFPFTYRTSTSEAKRFGSVSSSNSNWGYGGDADAIAFQVSKPVYIYGLTAIGGQGEYSASIELRTGTGSNSGELLASASHTFNSSDDSLIPLHFETPVWVEEDTNYTAVIRIQSDLSSHSGQSGSATVDVDGVTFRFSSASDENNGTDVSSGQVHSLLFSENASATVVQPGQKIEQITCNLPLVLIAALSQKTPELFKLLSQSEITPTPAASDSLSAVVVETTLVRHALATVLEFTSIDEVASTFELFESFGYERGNLLLGVLSNSLRKLFEDDDPQEVCELLGSLLDSEEIDHSACSTDGNMLSLAIRNGYSPDIIAILLRNGADITAAENFRTPAGRHVGPLLNLAFEAYIDESPEWLAEIAGQLIDAGLNPNEAADDHFPTPHYIAWNTRKSNSARQSKTVEFLALLKERGLNPSLPLSDYSAGSDFQKKYGFAYAATLTPVKFAKGEVREWFTAQAE